MENYIRGKKPSSSKFASKMTMCHECDTERLLLNQRRLSKAPSPELLLPQTRGPVQMKKGQEMGKEGRSEKEKESQVNK